MRRRVRTIVTSDINQLASKVIKEGPTLHIGMYTRKMLRGINTDDYYRMVLDFGGLCAEGEEDGAKVCSLVPVMDYEDRKSEMQLVVVGIGELWIAETTWMLHEIHWFVMGEDCRSSKGTQQDWNPHSSLNARVVKLGYVVEQIAFHLML
jgi:hypothetical protein